MKKVIFSLLLAFALIGIVSVFFDFVFRNAPWGIYKKLHDIIEENTYYDVWIIGSSRAETAFETNFLTQKTGLKFFNAGIHGSKTPQSYFILKHILCVHPAPKFVILDIDVHNLETVDTLLNIEQFAPYLHHSTLRKDFSTIDKRINYAYYIPIYELSFYGLRGFSKLIRILINKPGRYDTTFQYTGCYHSHTNYQFDHYSDITTSFQFHSVNTNYMDSAIQLCKKNNVDIIFTVSPIFQPNSNIFNAILKLKTFCENKNVLLMDFSNIKNISYNLNKFSDKYHLKFNGSVEFSYLFIDSLAQRNILKLSKKHN